MALFLEAELATSEENDEEADNHLICNCSGSLLEVNK
jgi:hypothetical protein